MSTIYLLYTPGGDPLFSKISFRNNPDIADGLLPRRLIKIIDYDETDPESGSMSIVPVSSETSSSPPDIYRPEMSNPVPSVPKITPSILYEVGIASPSKEEEANIRRYNLNIFNVMEFTENYGGSQSETNVYYKEALDEVKKSLTTSEYTKVNDKTSREDYIIHNNRVIEYVIVYIRTMNNYKYIDTEDIKQILLNLNYIHAQLDNIYKQIGPYINKKLGRTSYDNAVIKLKVAVAYYLLAEYKDADEIFESIDLNEVPSNSLLYMYIKYYHALVKQVQLDFLESDRLIDDVINNNNDLQTNSPNMFIRCMMVRGDNALFLYNKSQALSFYEKISTIKFTVIKADNPNEQEFYDTIPEIMNTLVKSRYATVKYYVGDTKPTFAELQGIVSTFREHLPAFHPYTVDAQVTLLLTNFASKPVVNQSTLIDLMERMYIVNWNVYPMKFLHYMSLYSLVKPQVDVNKKINVYDIIVNEYIEQIAADKMVFLSNNDNENILNTDVSVAVENINNKKDEIKSYFDTTTDIPVKGLRSRREGGFHELPALFVFDYLKTILLNTSVPTDKTRDALNTRFQEAILDRIPEQKDSLRVAVKNPIDTIGLPGKEPHLFKAVLYEVIGGDDKELLKMARDEYLQSDISARKVLNLYRATFDIEGVSVEVDLVTKVERGKGLLEKFGKGKVIPDYVRVATIKDGNKRVGMIRMGDKFKLPEFKEDLVVDAYRGGINGMMFEGILYTTPTGESKTLLRPSLIDDTITNPERQVLNQQKRAKQWIYLSQTLPQVPIKGGTRSKRRTPLEKKTRKVRGGLSVKMEE